MKKLSIVILIIIMIMSLCACASNTKDDEAIETEITTVINSEAYLECFLKYSDVKGVLADITTIDDNGDGTYNIYGIVIVNDNYNQHYEGKFDAIVSIDSSGKGSCDYFSMETPVKTNY